MFENWSTLDKVIVFFVLSSALSSTIGILIFIEPARWVPYLFYEAVAVIMILGCGVGYSDHPVNPMSHQVSTVYPIHNEEMTEKRVQHEAT